MDYKQQLIEYSKTLGFEKFGVASIDRFAEARPGEHPEEILPGAKSVIVMCIRLLDGAMSATFRRFEDEMKDVHGIYGTYGYTMAPTFHQAMGIYAMAQKIETETGAVACPMFTGGPLVNGAAFSLRHAANAAGLGEFGWNGIMLTPEFGPRNRFSAIITTLELEPDPMYSGEPLCDPTKCQICVEACPSMLYRLIFRVILKPFIAVGKQRNIAILTIGVARFRAICLQRQQVAKRIGYRKILPLKK